MKKKSLLVLLFSAVLFNFTACSSSDDADVMDFAGISQGSTNYMAEYKNVLSQINSQEASLAKLREELKTLSGGRAIVVQQQIAEKTNKLAALKRKKKDLENKLGL